MAVFSIAPLIGNKIGEGVEGRISDTSKWSPQNISDANCSPVQLWENASFIGLAVLICILMVVVSVIMDLKQKREEEQEGFSNNTW